MLNIPTFTKYNKKDAIKFRKCNKLIAYAQEGSTALYARSNPDRVNCGNYNKDDIVGISLNGASRPNWRETMQLAINELKLAIDAGATIVADDFYDRNREYNYHTEGHIITVLAKHGYIEKPSGSGIWKCNKSSLIQKSV